MSEPHEQLRKLAEAALLADVERLTAERDEANWWVEKLRDQRRQDAARCDQLAEALAVYENAVQKALKAAPNHWQAYRDPFELGPGIREARDAGRAALAALEEPTP